MATRSKVIKAAATEVDAAIVVIEAVAGNTVTQVIRVTVSQFLIVYTTA